MKKFDWFNEIVTQLKDIYTKEFWCDGEQIICANESQAEFLANFIEKHYESQGETVTTITGYYDKTEDERHNTVDDYSGMWYITLN